MPARIALPPRLRDMRNLGRKAEEWLPAIGVPTPHALRKRGAIATYVELKRSRPGVSLTELYALVGALEDLDWLDIKRNRKFELLLQVEDYERRHPRLSARDELLALRNIGPAMRDDFKLLGITTRAQLAQKSPDALYVKLSRLTGSRQDPCVWDTFAAAIQQARTGEALPWWEFTAQRKQRMATGTWINEPLKRARKRR
jgi:hypothetical protein